MTAQYVLDALGPTHSFETRIVGSAPMIGGRIRIDGDLILVGGSDPMLDTDDLAAMAASLVARGLREVTGRLLVLRRPSAGPAAHRFRSARTAGL